VPLAPQASIPASCRNAKPPVPPAATPACNRDSHPRRLPKPLDWVRHASLCLPTRPAASNPTGYHNTLGLQSRRSQAPAPTGGRDPHLSGDGGRDSHRNSHLGWHRQLRFTPGHRMLERRRRRGTTGQGSANRWEPGRFDRFPVLPVRPGSKIDQEPVPNRT
jgi:hypothetical protein